MCRRRSQHRKAEGSAGQSASDEVRAQLARRSTPAGLFRDQSFNFPPLSRRGCDTLVLLVPSSNWPPRPFLSAPDPCALDRKPSSRGLPSEPQICSAPALCHSRTAPVTCCDWRSKPRHFVEYICPCESNRENQAIFGVFPARKTSPNVLKRTEQRFNLRVISHLLGPSPKGRAPPVAPALTPQKPPRPGPSCASVERRER